MSDTELSDSASDSSSARSGGRRSPTVPAHPDESHPDGEQHERRPDKHGMKDKPINSTDARNKPDPLGPTSETWRNYKPTKFAVPPGPFQLLADRSYSAFYALGGMVGLEKLLATNLETGLDPNEIHIGPQPTLEDASKQFGTDYYTPELTDKGVYGFDTAEFETRSNQPTAHPSTLTKWTFGMLGSKSSKKARKAWKAYNQAQTVHDSIFGFTPAGICKLEEESSEPVPFYDRKMAFSNNHVPPPDTKSLLGLVWEGFDDRMIRLLCVAAVVSLALGLYQTFGQTHENGEANVEWVEGVAIIVAILIVVIASALTDWRKEREFQRLQRSEDQGKTATVIRGGQRIPIPLDDILVGDIVTFKSGDMIHVDGLLLHGDQIKCDESQITGEAEPRPKRVAKLVQHHLAEDDRMLDPETDDPFMISGTSVRSGTGSYLATSTGIFSRVGKIKLAMRVMSKPTMLQQKLGTLANQIARFGIFAGVSLFVVLTIIFCIRLPGSTLNSTEKGQQFLEIFIVAVTIVVVAVPEGLPLAVTITLAFAVGKMKTENNLVRYIEKCEVMGNAEEICSDKTGTLTTNQMLVVRGVLNGIKVVPNNSDMDTPVETQTPKSPLGKTPTDIKALKSPVEAKDQSLISYLPTASLSKSFQTIFQELCITSSDMKETVTDGKATFDNQGTETAILEYVRDNIFGGYQLRETFNLVLAIPFQSEQKFSGSIVRTENGYRLYMKGGPELVAKRCVTMLNDDEAVPKDESVIEKQQDTFARLALRTLGFAYRDLSPGVLPLEEELDIATALPFFTEMVFIGMVAIKDPLRKEVPHAIQQCKKAGVKVRMLTGDHPVTALAIAEEAGLVTKGKHKIGAGVVVEGSFMDGKTDEQIAKELKKGYYRVVARCQPSHKETLVRVQWDIARKVVAVTGDGTNDAPALKAASVGFAMGSGTAAAKSASDIILLDDSFSSIVTALKWGRVVNDAVRKFLQFQLTVNVTAVVTTFVTAVSSSQQHSILNAVQLLWVNLIMDTLGALALATDSPTEKILDRKPDKLWASLISSSMWENILGQSVFQLTMLFLIYYGGKKTNYFDTPEEVERHPTFVFNVFVFMQIFNLLSSRHLDTKTGQTLADTVFGMFKGLHRNWIFWIIYLTMIGGQVLIIFKGGQAFQVKPLSGREWGLSIGIGACSLLWGIAIRCMKITSFLDEHMPGFKAFRHKRELTRKKKVLGMLDVNEKTTPRDLEADDDNGPLEENFVSQRLRRRSTRVGTVNGDNSVVARTVLGLTLFTGNFASRTS